MTRQKTERRMTSSGPEEGVMDSNTSAKAENQESRAPRGMVLITDEGVRKMEEMVTSDQSTCWAAGRAGVGGGAGKNPTKLRQRGQESGALWRDLTGTRILQDKQTCRFTDFNHGIQGAKSDMVGRCVTSKWRRRDVFVDQGR